MFEGSGYMILSFIFFWFHETCSKINKVVCYISGQAAVTSKFHFIDINGRDLTSSNPSNPKSFEVVYILYVTYVMTNSRNGERKLLVPEITTTMFASLV